MKHIVIIVGSLRKGSFNKQLATIINEQLHEFTTEFLSYENIPFFNEDNEFPTPLEIKQVRNNIKKADGIWIVSPEYNGEIPGALKNLLDWLSRPEKPNDWETGSVLKNKLITISSIAGKSKGLGVRTSLARLLKRLEMRVIHDVGTGISFNEQTFISQQVKLSNIEENLLKQQIQTFTSAIK